MSGRRYCRKCDSHVIEETMFCPVCGSLLETAMEASNLKERVRRSSLVETEELMVGIEFISSEQRERSPFILCSWAIHLPAQMNGGFIDALRSWTDSKVNTDDHVGKWIIPDQRENGVQTFNLKISGIGKDGRCSWCRSFRSALESKLIRNDMRFVREGACTDGY